jgi:hypothetical protein
MVDSEHPLYEWEQHKTPRDLAIYYRTKGSTVGRRYLTETQIWKADDSKVQIGLLHLIVDKLEEIAKANSKVEDRLLVHRRWLNHYKGFFDRMDQRHKQERARLKKMFGRLRELGEDVTYSFCPNHAAKLFATERILYDIAMRNAEDALKRMQAVKEPSDVVSLKGIKKVRAAKILKRLQTEGLAIESKKSTT